MSNYIISWSTNKVILRNYEGIISTYKEPDAYEPKFCNRKCNDCHLTLRLDEASEERAVGISKLLADHDDETTLVPERTVRVEKRKDEERKLEL